MSHRTIRRLLFLVLLSLPLAGCPRGTEETEPANGSGGESSSLTAYENVTALALEKEARERVQKEAPGVDLKLARINGTNLDEKGTFNLLTFETTQPRLLQYIFSNGKKTWIVDYTPDPLGGAPIINVHPPTVRGLTPLPRKDLLDSDKVAERFRKEGLSGLTKGGTIRYDVVDDEPVVQIASSDGRASLTLQAETGEVLARLSEEEGN